MNYFNRIRTQRVGRYDFGIFYNTKTWEKPINDWSGHFGFVGLLIKHCPIVNIQNGICIRAFDIMIIIRFIQIVWWFIQAHCFDGEIRVNWSKSNENHIQNQNASVKWNNENWWVTRNSYSFELINKTYRKMFTIVVPKKFSRSLIILLSTMAKLSTIKYFSPKILLFNIVSTSWLTSWLLQDCGKQIPTCNMV